jgi:TetR/AcrR family transcriptional repressor of mexJK operon
MTSSRPLKTNALSPGDLPTEARPIVPSDKARAVLAGARAIFLAHGFNAATTDMIQQAAAVSKSTVYAHYPNKEALFTAVVEAECESFLKTARELTFSENRLADNLSAMAKAYLDIVLSPEGLALFRVIAAEAPRFPELGRRFYVAGPGAMNNIVAKALDVALLKGDIDLGGVGRDAAASLFVSMVRGEPHMQCLAHPDSKPSAAQVDQWASDAVTTFLRAFKSAK